MKAEKEERCGVTVSGAFAAVSAYSLGLVLSKDLERPFQMIESKKSRRLPKGQALGPNISLLNCAADLAGDTFPHEHAWYCFLCQYLNCTAFLSAGRFWPSVLRWTRKRGPWETHLELDNHGFLFWFLFVKNYIATLIVEFPMMQSYSSQSASPYNSSMDFQ